MVFDELDTRRANALAAYLRRLGVGPEVRVGIALERSLDMVVGLLGVLKAGAAYVPLDPAYPQERLGYMIEDLRTPVLLTRSDLLQVLPAHAAQVLCLDRVADELHARGIPVAVVSNVGFDIRPLPS